MFQVIAGALASGAAPSLRTLALGNAAPYDDEMESLTAMLEARVQHPGCCGLEAIKIDDLLVDHEYPAGLRRRFLRAMLRSVTEMNNVEWDDDCEAAFLEVRPPSLKTLVLAGGESPSRESFEAMLQLEELNFFGL